MRECVLLVAVTTSDHTSYLELQVDPEVTMSTHLLGPWHRWELISLCALSSPGIGASSSPQLPRLELIVSLEPSLHSGGAALDSISIARSRKKGISPLSLVLSQEFQESPKFFCAPSKSFLYCTIKSHNPS